MILKEIRVDVHYQMDLAVVVVVAVVGAVVEVVAAAAVVVISQLASEVLVECLYQMIFNGIIRMDYHHNF